MTDTPNDDDLNIELDGAEPTKVNGHATDSTDTSAGLEALKAQLAQEKANTEAANRRAELANQSAEQAREGAKNSDLSLLANAIERVKVEAGVLKSKYRDALVAQDFDAAAEVQQQMTTAAVNLSKLEEGKAQLETQARQRAGDPIERFVKDMDPRSANWVRQHPQFVHDPVLTQRMIAAHNLVVTDGIKENSDDYFKEIETILRLRPKEAATQTVVRDDSIEVDPTAQTAKVISTREAAPPVIPVTRDGGSNRRTIRLSRDEVEMAEATGLTPEEYARNKAQLIKEGILH